MPRSTYPLQWPVEQPRTPDDHRKQSSFSTNGKRGEVSIYEAAMVLKDELRLMKAINIVITSDLPTRTDGIPYADSRARVKDVGIAVWFFYQGKESVLACDKWRSHGENLRSIAKTIEAIRALERYGCASATERAMSGFAALPAGSEETFGTAPRKRPWREVLGGTWPAELEPDDLLAMAKARYKKAMAAAHPDHGGAEELAADLNLAMDEATFELSLGSIR